MENMIIKIERAGMACREKKFHLHKINETQ